MPEMKVPGPDHPITVTSNPKRVRARYRGHVIADSAGALTLKEAAYKPVFYFPRDDVSMEFLHRTEHHTFCPYKGEASYYSLMMDGDLVENAVWSYEAPFDAMSMIAGYLAFYPQQVEIYELDESHTEIDEAVLHTDSGSGSSQREHWPTNVDDPNQGPLTL
ncbi:MAG TPA: DUF427 domain-containing protein [Caulobacteraceae bacterium]|nr:DUF427 domain-containing protein [Caulobacteraceae bacterium]